jgi:hypothetical protein
VRRDGGNIVGQEHKFANIDIFGLPVFKVTKTIEERIGDEIHILHGYEMFGQMCWTHIEIMLVEDLISASIRCRNIAMEATRQIVCTHG